METQKKKLVLFDFDGVICDSFEHGISVRKKMGIADASPHTYRLLFEGNIIHASLESDGEDGLKKFFDIASDGYSGLGCFVGIHDAIEHLSKKYTLAIVSSTINSLIEECARANNLLHYFSELLGSDVHASKVEKIKMALTKYSVPHEECVFITDTLGDVLEANRVGVDAVCVLWGFHPRETLEHGRVSHFVNSPQELANLVDTHFFPDCDCKKPKV